MCAAPVQPVLSVLAIQDVDGAGAEAALAFDAVCAALQRAGLRVTRGSRLLDSLLDSPTTEPAPNAVLLHAPDAGALAAWAALPALAQLCVDQPVLLLAPVSHAAHEAQLLQQGVQAIVDTPAELPRAIRHAVLRKQAERSARNAYATDLATGLPHQAQLLEHMTQLLALREREPAPMVLLVLRIDGSARVAARLGAEAGNILRRKVAVRLRGGLRASDVVAAIGPDAFGILLGHVEAKADGERVAAKLVRALQQPLSVSGQSFTVSTAVGLALYPEHGKDANSLLQRASAQAGSVATMGSQGFGSAISRGPGAAANDDAQ